MSNYKEQAKSYKEKAKSYKEEAKSHKEEVKYLKDVIEAYKLAMNFIEDKTCELITDEEEHENMIEAIDDAKDIIYDKVEIFTELRNRTREELIKYCSFSN